MFDILFQNNATKQDFILEQQVNLSDNHLYLRFEDVDLPEGMEDGEYTYAVVANVRDDVVYERRTPILDTIVHTDDGDVILRDLCPLIGTLRVGEVNDVAVYDENKNKTYYYEG